MELGDAEQMSAQIRQEKFKICNRIHTLASTNFPETFVNQFVMECHTCQHMLHEYLHNSSKEAHESTVDSPVRLSDAGAEHEHEVPTPGSSDVVA
eukprot:GFYU01065532.1.p1 GENE.GFYU01065532.1~~GFYU01065532.1.p1  ORF type:complete len:110 (-),score=28.01 GFYU01065532.1:34-318(-)